MKASVTMLDGVAGALALRELAGDDSATDALLVAHANGFHGACYRAFAQALDANVRVFALDFRGHGESAAPTELDGFAWSGMTEDASTAIDYLTTLGLERIHGFGHSIGGAALIDLERRRPGTFATLFAFEPVMAPIGAYDPDSPLTRSAEGRLRGFPSKADALMRYAARPPLGWFRADVLFDYVTNGFTDQPDGTVVLKCLPENEAEIYRRAGQTVHLDIATEIESVVIIGRSGDGGLPAQLAEPIVAKLSQGQLLDFPDITHFGPLQDPVTVAKAMREIIDSDSN